MYVKRKFTWCVGAVPVELTLGECVKLLGDLDSHIDTTENADLGILLDNIRAKVDGEPVQTAHHKKNRFSSRRWPRRRRMYSRNWPSKEVGATLGRPLPHPGEDGRRLRQGASWIHHRRPGENLTKTLERCQAGLRGARNTHCTTGELQPETAGES